jgi:hypothetical protein
MHPQSQAAYLRYYTPSCDITCSFRRIEVNLWSNLQVANAES